VAGNAHPIEDLRDLVAQHSPFDISDFTDAEIEASLNQLGLDYTNISKTLAADEIP
jgi:hypothetical protein